MQTYAAWVNIVYACVRAQLWNKKTGDRALSVPSGFCLQCRRTLVMRKIKASFSPSFLIWSVVDALFGVCAVNSKAKVCACNHDFVLIQCIIVCCSECRCCPRCFVLVQGQCCLLVNLEGCLRGEDDGTNCATDSVCMCVCMSIRLFPNKQWHIYPSRWRTCWLFTPWLSYTSWTWFGTYAANRCECVYECVSA